MAVIVEGVSVITNVASVLKKFNGGSRAFLTLITPENSCADGSIVGVRFMKYDSALKFVERLKAGGLSHGDDSAESDIVIVDQRLGMEKPCPWLMFGESLWGGDPSKPIAICSKYPIDVKKVVVPDGWKFETSLSNASTFVDENRLDTEFEFVRSDGGVDVYLRKVDGKEYFVAR